MFNWLSELFSRPPIREQDMQVVKRLVSENSIAIFSKSWCPYCARAKSTLKAIFPSANIGILELDQIDDGDKIQAALASFQEKRSLTVPQIYIKGELIGGSDDLQSLMRSQQWARLKDSVTQ